jgi:hypothetical protein
MSPAEVETTGHHDNNLFVDIYTQYLKADLPIVSSWAKKDLFRYCKFVQDNKEDLSTTSKIYVYFKQTFGTSDILRGIKASKNDIRIDAQRYLDRIWTFAEKKGTIRKGLGYRRSAIYTVMQNRFRGKKYMVYSDVRQLHLTNFELH